ncbi:hypothetical protein P154DRAFT_114494 [Amniculicola lignicola CBS 123094]|uniref:Uncharacterized protein n=1 Tax=Amniculicola lignicola CBS 123094 TaxID=1392246 RepID=A0A6A5WZK5_9PLEO|nr:hypothetical protein P154DRAFT_114494 [Amniculicola lignicola CBS 123094]
MQAAGPRAMPEAMVVGDGRRVRGRRVGSLHARSGEEKRNWLNPDEMQPRPPLLSGSHGLHPARWARARAAIGDLLALTGERTGRGRGVVAVVENAASLFGEMVVLLGTRRPIAWLEPSLPPHQPRAQASPPPLSRRSAAAHTVPTPRFPGPGTTVHSPPGYGLQDMTLAVARQPALLMECVLTNRRPHVALQLFCDLTADPRQHRRPSRRMLVWGRGLPFARPFAGVLCHKASTTSSMCLATAKRWEGEAHARAIARLANGSAAGIAGRRSLVWFHDDDRSVGGHSEYSNLPATPFCQHLYYPVR